MDVLGLGIQLCKRAKQLFLGLLDDYSGAAAAYSLRKLSRGYSGPIIRVRRDSDDAELDFNSTTSIEDWVNGKQETTLPVDLTKVGDGSNAYFSNPDSSYYDCGTFSVGAGETWEAEVEMAILSFANHILPFGYNSWASGYGLIFYSDGRVRAFSHGTVIIQQPSGVTEGQLFTAKYGYDGSNVFVDINGNRVYTSAANTQTGASNVPLRLGGGSNLTDNPCIIKSAKLTVNGTLIRNYTNITPASTITDATGTQDATVSGSLSDIKTADEATTAAAYSLRKVRSTYTGDAVRIRRASDDVEVDVAFDTNGDVSASSAVTNIPSNFPTTEVENGTPSGDAYDTLTPNGLTGFSASTVDAARCGYAINDGTTGEVVSVTITIADYSGSGSLFVRLRPGLDTAANASNTYTITSNGTHSFNLTATADFSHVVFIATADLSFTASGVSILSADQGDTTATTLGGFLTGNENSLVDFSSGSDNLFSHDDQTTIVFESYGNDLSRTAYNHLTDSESIGSSPVSTSDYSFRLDSRVSSGYNAAHGILIGPKVEQYFYSVTFKYYIPEGEPSLSVVYGTPVASLNVKGAWTEATITSQVGQSHRNFLLRSGAFGSTGGLWYIADIRMNLSAFDTFVQTWYDQSANSNHATQDVAGDQPKIAEAGALLADGIDFDGTNSQMDIVGFVPLSTAYTAFTVATIDNPTSSSLKTIFDNTDTGNGGFAVGYGNTANKLTPFMYHGNSSVPVVFSAGSDLTSNKSLYSVQFTSGNSGTFINSTSDDADSTTWSSAGSNAFTKSTIGYDQATPGRNFNGKLNEFIIYETDQTTNRFKIESNINNYYGIYTASHNGFVHTWYDQSGNSNDATQDTLEDEQPTIVSAGSLLADGIDFDGVDDKLNFTALSASDLSIFSVVTFDSVAGQERIIGPQSGANEGFGIGNATTGFFRASGTANGPSLNATISADTTTLYSLIRASNTGTFFTDSTASATFSNTDTFAGASLGGATNPVDGSLKEIIIYTSDQTANRSGIESNIADEYGITLP